MSPTNKEHSTAFRYELKVPLQRLQFLQLESWLQQSGVTPKKTFPDRQVHSVYLDSHELHDYQDNVAGISRRGKVRFRWYDTATNKMVLELKNKRGKLANKLVVDLANPHGVVPLRRVHADQLLRSHRRSALLARQCNLFPALHVVYERAYYELAPDIRMTVDRHIHYQKLYPLTSNNVQSSVVDTVVEFKYPREKLQQATALLKGLPARVFRHSKYIIGVDTVCDL